MNATQAQSDDEAKQCFQFDDKVDAWTTKARAAESYYSTPGRPMACTLLRVATETPFYAAGSHPRNAADRRHRYLPSTDYV